MATIGLDSQAERTATWFAMAIYELTNNQINRVAEARFSEEGVRERDDLQRLLRVNVECVSPDTLILTEEFSQWEDSRRRIDLLGIDKDANLVVIELKRTDDGGHMDLQAIRYAAMVSTMTYEQVVAVHTTYLHRHEPEQSADENILDFLEWDEPNEDKFAQDVRIVLVSADFSKELTTAVIWLNAHGLDIRCVRLKPYTLDGRLILDVQQIIPLPEAIEYQVQVREKAQKERFSRGSGGPDFTKYNISVGGETFPNQWKRRAILLVIKALVSRGVALARITDSIQRKHLSVSAEGRLNSDELAFHANEAAKARGKRFDRRRWFLEEDDIILADGRSYAITNQWGSEWPEAMTRLAGAFPEHVIKFEPVSD